MTAQHIVARGLNCGCASVSVFNSEQKVWRCCHPGTDPAVLLLLLLDCGEFQAFLEYCRPHSPHNAFHALYLLLTSTLMLFRKYAGMSSPPLKPSVVCGWLTGAPTRRADPSTRCAFLAKRLPLLEAVTDPSSCMSFLAPTETFFLFLFSLVVSYPCLIGLEKTVNTLRVMWSGTLQESAKLERSARYLAFTCNKYQYFGNLPN